LRVHREEAVERSLTEVYLIGNTAGISLHDMRSLPGVERAVRVSEEYRVLGGIKEMSDLPFRLSGRALGQDTLARLRRVVCSGQSGRTSS